MAEQRVPTVAVIGSGAAGLGAAWLLSRAPYNVHLFESSSTLGGHAHTVDLPLPGSGSSPSMTIPVDTGFIVYNTRTYPDLVSLFELLGVEEENSSMSFASSVTLPSSGHVFEWGSDSLASLFADRKNLYRPAMYTMLYDMNRFNTAVYDFVSAVDNDPTFKDRDMTLRQFLNKGAYSPVFVRAYLVPMVSAVWSASFNSALKFPARSLFHFFVNHGLAQVFNRPQWRTPAKRSRDYVNRLIGDFKAHGGTVHLSTKVTAATRNERYCTVQVNHADRPMRFDHLVFATHAPDTLDILGDDATDDERRILSQFEYSTNNAFVHHDERLMPANKAVWSSWNFIGQRSDMSNSSDEKTTAGGASSKNLSDDSIPEDISAESTTEMKESNQKVPETSAKNDNPSVDVDNKNDSKTNEEKTEGGGGGIETSDEDPVCVSYWLNRLQNYHKYHLPVPDLFITLNPVIPIRPDKILLRLSYDHPQFTEAAVNAQPELQKVIQGKNRTWFCGAYTRFGFHEDAMMSGLDVAEKLTEYTTIRPWRMKNCMAINDHSRQYDFPLTPSSSGGISSRFSQFMFLAGLLVINTVIARLQIGLGKIAARMADHHPVVLVASGEGRLHRFGPKHVRRRRTNSFFTFSQMLTQPPQSASSSSSSLPGPLPSAPPSASLSSFVADGSTTIQPSAARLTVRNPTVLARIADALRHGSELAPIAAAAFAAGEFDCPSPTDLSETLRSLFIAHGLDDPSKARKGRAKLAENLLSSIVGKFDHVRAISAHTRLPELTTCMLNVVSPSWWLELDQTCSGDSDMNNVQLQKQQGQEQQQQQSQMSLFKSMVSPHDLKDVSSILELGGDLSELTVAMLQSSSSRRATVAVQTNERIEFVKCKAELLLVAEQVNVMLLSELRNRRETGFGLSDELDKDDEDMKFDLIFSPGTINNYRCCGFKSAKQVLEFIQSFCATNAVVELGVVVYGNRQKSSADEKKAFSKNAIFSSDDGYRLWEIPDVMQISSNMKRLDLQRVAFLHEEEAAMDIHEVIQRVYNSLAIDKLEPKETRLVLAQMCLWQAALGVKYLRRMAVSFTYR